MSAHSLSLRVYYEDTDAAGIVYYANYLRFAERGRTEMLRALGFNQSETSRRYGIAFAVKECRIAYHRPARLDDLLEVRSQLNAVSGAALVAEQGIHRGAEELARLVSRIACIDNQGRAVRIPAALRDALHSFLRGSQQG